MVIKAAQAKEKYFGEYPWAKEKIGIAETSHLRYGAPEHERLRQ
jgi:hypothetical protein